MSILECSGSPHNNIFFHDPQVQEYAEQSMITSTVLNPSFFIKPQGLKGEGRATFY